MEGFPGFPDGKLELTSLPELFFSELLPIIDHLAELKVTLYCLWLIQQKQGQMPHITFAELEQDEILMRGLAGAGLPAHEALILGLERAVARGALLQVDVLRPSGKDERWYLINGPYGRAAVARIERGEGVPEEASGPVYLQARRPNIFNLYENNFGPIHSPLLADELKDAERYYPAAWVEEAFHIAVSNNVRRWAYVRSILERWAHEGYERRHS